ncbi:MAG: acyl-CoA thioesterase [Bacteroidia bacterium]|nr:acyl-CoA thioesterase [Bacteroidia bacterium]
MLIEKVEVKVRFSDVDPMGIVWHGNYIKYFEDAREAFGKKYGLGYMDVYRAGILAPIVKLKIDYKKPLRYDENAVIEIKYIDSEAAIMKFEYVIFKQPGNIIAVTGETIQAFVDTKGELFLTIPPFFEQWKRKWGIII